MNIGSIPVNKSIILAPMEDVSDRAFRTICRRMGADIVFTEFTSSEALIREVPKALRKIKFTQEERPLAIQIYGGVETSMEGAARIAESFAPDFIDINCGCWVKNVALRGDGAGLLRDLPKFEKIVKSVVNATKLPVTVKTRLGWNDESIVILDVARMIEQAGAQALTIHCRTRCQGYKGDADWTWLTKIKKVISIPLIGNGDVETPDDVRRMLETGADGVMIGRGAIHNPWIFRQAKHFLATGEYLSEPTLKEKIDVCVEHLKLSVDEKGIKGGLIPFRKHYAGYLRGVPNIAILRSELMQLVEFDPIVDRLYRFLDENSNIQNQILV